jgi:cytochrome c
MKNLIIPVLISIVASGAQASPELARKNNCMTCHAVDRKLVGPSYQEVARRHSGTAADKLAQSIRAGGKGQWGAMPMPAQPQLSDADARALAQWILSLK